MGASGLLGFNTAFAAASRLVGARNDPYLSFNFLVEIQGLLVGGFSEVTGLQIETEVETFREGGLNDYEHKLPGPTKYPSNLTLKHGLTDIETMWTWHQEVASGTVIRRNGTIYLLDNQRLPAMWWNFTGAYPVRWTGPELRAGSTAVAAESIELVHRGISKPSLSSAVSAVRGVAQAATDIAGGALGKLG
jgi:phage tail-like protein